MKWPKIEKDNGKESVKIPNSWLHIHYYEALTVLFRIENLLRIFVYIVLKAELNENWLNLNIKSEEETEGTINSISKRRMKIDNSYGYIGYPINSPMLHLTSGELISIIVSDNYWKYFKNYFPGKKEIIKDKLDEISNVRNALAHFRPIKEDDVDLVKVNAKHLLSNINYEILDLINGNENVPSNTVEDWFIELKKIKQENIKIEIKQTKNENWIKITLLYIYPITRKVRTYDKQIRVDVIDIITSNILENYLNIKNYCISISENIPYAGRIKELENSVKKEITIIFNKKTIEKHYTIINSEIENILNDINTETRLLMEDSLAKGNLLIHNNYLAKADYTGDNKIYRINTKNLSTVLKENNQIEYWGNIELFFGDDYLIESNEFPWIPVTISDDIIPF